MRSGIGARPLNSGVRHHFMPRRKPLKSVAHSVAHSFLSPMNYGPNGYAVEQIVKVAATRNIPVLVVDLLSGSHAPAMRARSVLVAVEAYSKAFPRLVARSGSDMKFVKSATMTLGGLNKALQTHWKPAAFQYRVTCSVEITSDEGRKYSAKLAEMWPGPSPRLRLVFNRGDA